MKTNAKALIQSAIGVLLFTTYGAIAQDQPAPPDDCEWFSVFDIDGEGAHLKPCQEFCVEVVEDEEYDARLGLGASVRWRNTDGSYPPIALMKVGAGSGPVQQYEFEAKVLPPLHEAEEDHMNYRLITFDIVANPNEAIVFGVKHGTIGPVHGGSAHARY
jgi:hypothetical protein